ncbi:MAG: exosortase system-associated protein, TIGR04073 family [Gammaproteobacteria bacterium]
MMTFYRFCATLSLVSLTIAHAPLSEAQPMPRYYDDIDAPSPQIPTKPQTYGERVGEKATSAFANLATGWLEMPKNVINTTNQSNVIYGFIGGLAKGMVHTAGRMGVGIADLSTLPIATKPIMYPLYIWDDFDVDTTYGDVMRLQELKRNNSEAAPPPAPQAAAPVAPVAAAPAPAPVQYPTDTNRKIDAIFKKEMMK